MLVPFGGGGLSVGIASAVKAVRPSTRVYAVEPETGAPLTAAFETGAPRPVDVRVVLPERGIEETIEALVAGETYVVVRVEDDQLLLQQLAEAPYYR